LALFGLIKKHTLAPGLSSIKAIFAKAKLKAIGEDLMGGELLRCAAAEIAKIVHPLFVKIFETSWIPTQMRGGHLFAILKKGDKQVRSNYRDVVAADCLSKAFGSSVRTEVLPYVRGLALQTQYGAGLNGGSIEMTHLHLRAMADITLARNFSFSAVFVDLSTAYASMNRRLAVGSDITDVELAARLRASGFDKDSIVRILSELRTLKVWDQVQTPRQLQALLQELLTGTWLAQEHIAGVLAYVSGTSAGTPLADLIFVVAFRTVFGQHAPSPLTRCRMRMTSCIRLPTRMPAPSYPKRKQR
jgi:hypothetical protein